MELDLYESVFCAVELSLILPTASTSQKFHLAAFTLLNMFAVYLKLTVKYALLHCWNEVSIYLVYCETTVFLVLDLATIIMTLGLSIL